jgi:hypothetical protein
MDIEQFRNLVAGYTNRTLISLVDEDTSVDYVNTAMNQAKKWAQREHNFELCRCSVDVVTSKSAGGDLLSAKLHGTNEGVKLKLIERAFVPIGGGYIPANYISRNNQVKTIQRASVNPRDRRGERGVAACSTPQQYNVVRQANTILVEPWNDSDFSTSMTTVLDIVRWLPEYGVSLGSDGLPEGTIETDFFLEDCDDWLLLRTLSFLNLYLKEDQRVAISAAAMKDAWGSVLTWDNDLTASNVDDNTLD